MSNPHHNPHPPNSPHKFDHVSQSQNGRVHARSTLHPLTHFQISDEDRIKIIEENVPVSKLQDKEFTYDEKGEIFGGTRLSVEIFREALCTGLEFRFGRRKSSHHFQILKFLSCDQI